MSTYSLHGTTMIRMAEAFATGAHGAIEQKRKYTGEDYINHPRSVAAMIKVIPGHSWQQIVVAWLHDTVEDTGVTLRQIQEMFGGEIAMAVMHLTNVEKSMGNRRQRHEMNVTRLRNAPDWVKTDKVADIYDNTKNIVALDPKFAPQYLQEKTAAMLALKGADEALWVMTMNQITRLQKEILLAS